VTPKDMLTNPHFCPMPWTGLMYNFDGTVKNCIRSNQRLGNIQDHDIKTILTNSENQKRQQSILDVEPVASCSPCKDLENNKRGFDMISDRIFYIKELKHTDPALYSTVGQHDLKTIDVRWTNLCNFACVYCSADFSSKWADELSIQHAVPTQTQLDEFKNYIFDHATQLRHVYMAGGEPLLMKQNLELLELLLEKNPLVNLRINTNLSRTDTKVFERICEFKNVHWTVSVESMDKQFEYIRYGGSWSDFLTNLDRIQNCGHKVSFNMLWFLLNYDTIFDCVDFLRAQGFHPNSFVIGALLGPEYLNIRHLPKYVLQSLEHKLKELIMANPGYLLEDSYCNMLNYIQQPFEGNLNASFKKLQDMDQRRGLNSSCVFKELYKLREEN
jgi:MoaA/NifB/PqqE/SkfB family radical SAM enzyme